jgi:hypothetical protein
MADNTATLNANSTAWRGRTGGPKQGLYTANGTGAQTVFNIAHGLGAVPTFYWTSPVTPAAKAPYTVTKDATNLIMTFATAPVFGTNNIKLHWAVSGGTLGVGYPR